MSVCLSFCWSAVFLSACCLQLAYYVLSCRWLVFAAFAFADDVAATVAVVAAAADVADVAFTIVPGLCTPWTPASPGRLYF